MTTTKRNKWADAGRVIVYTACLLLYVIGYLWYKETLVAWWIPVTIAGAFGLLTAPMLRRKWKWLTSSDDNVYLWFTHIFVVGAIVYAALLGGNRLPGASDALYEENVTVEKVIRRTHKQYRRVGRRYVVQNGQTTTSYALKVRLADGSRKEISASRTSYHQSRVNDCKVLTLRKGAFGMPVIVKVSNTRTLPSPADGSSAGA